MSIKFCFENLSVILVRIHLDLTWREKIFETKFLQMCKSIISNEATMNHERRIKTLDHTLQDLK